MQHVMGSTESFPINEFLSSDHLEAKLYPPIAPLSQTFLPLQEIQAGVMGVSVGLLPGKCSKIMEKHLPVREMMNMCLMLACLV